MPRPRPDDPLAAARGANKLSWLTTRPRSGSGSERTVWPAASVLADGRARLATLLSKRRSTSASPVVQTCARSAKCVVRRTPTRRRPVAGTRPKEQRGSPPRRSDSRDRDHAVPAGPVADRPSVLKQRRPTECVALCVPSALTETGEGCAGVPVAATMQGCSAVLPPQSGLGCELACRAIGRRLPQPASFFTWVIRWLCGRAIGGEHDAEFGAFPGGAVELDPAAEGLDGATDDR
jgi:hypothetical protein